MKRADFYDFVIIGNSLAGTYLLQDLAEMIANQYNHQRWRVAWVVLGPDHLLSTDVYTAEDLANLALKWQAAGIDVITSPWRFIPDHQAITEKLDLTIPLAQVLGFQSQWSRTTKGMALQVFDDASGLSEGVSQCSFALTDPNSGARVLYARYWVIAARSIDAKGVINLQPPHYTLAKDLLPLKHSESLGTDQLFPKTVVQQVAFLADDPRSLSTAQNLAHAGYDVTLIVQQSRLLPDVDPEIVQILQSQMEVQGIKVKICGRLTAIKAFAPNHTRLWLGQTTLDTERLVLSAPPRLWLTEKYHLPPDVLWYQSNDQLRQIRLLTKDSTPRSGWRSWLLPWATPARPPHINLYQQFRLTTKPTLLHYGALGEQSYRLIVTQENTRDLDDHQANSAPVDLERINSRDMGIAKIQVTDGKIVGFSSIGSNTMSLGRLMSWLVDHEVTYAQWLQDQNELL